GALSRWPWAPEFRHSNQCSRSDQYNVASIGRTIMNRKKVPASNPVKLPTGIEGFDDITNGGLPRGRTTLLSGGPGSGKTLFGLRFLAYGARNRGEGGIFVAFE